MGQARQRLAGSDYAVACEYLGPGLREPAAGAIAADEYDLPGRCGDQSDRCVAVEHEVLSDDLTVDEMDHAFLLVHEMDKMKVVATIARRNDRTLIFVRTKRGADRLVRNLQPRFPFVVSLASLP